MNQRGVEGKHEDDAEGVGWGILKEQELAGIHEKPMDLQRIPKETNEVPRQDMVTDQRNGYRHCTIDPQADCTLGGGL